MRVRFGEWVLDSDTRQLFVRGEAVHLSPKAFQFLELLLESCLKALSKSEIHERLWPGTFVSDGTLASFLVEVRSATGDRLESPVWCGPFTALVTPSAESRRNFGKAFPPRGQKLIYRLIWGNREIGCSGGAPS